jgi:hypothetical protein
MKIENLSSSVIKNYILKPIKAGILGFTSFLVVLILTKLISVIIGTVTSFQLEMDDILLSSIGFILLFLIRFLENFRDQETEKFV